MTEGAGETRSREGEIGRVLVLGASGMLGHKVLQVFSERFEAYGTVRGARDVVSIAAPHAAEVVEGVSADSFQTVIDAVEGVSPDVVVNCIGIVKQLDAAKDAVASIEINSLFPHRLARLCHARRSRLVHISTDCVFSGRRGAYTESDIPDPVDLYGRSKLLGEVSEEALTIRTSIVGRELHGAHGLVEWFLNQREDAVRGFTRAIFSGWSTAALAGALADVIETRPDLTGLWHVAAEPISKFDFLRLVREAFDLDVEIEPDPSFVCDRSLDGSRFRVETGIVAPPWEEMVRDLRQETPSYDSLRVRALANG